MSEPPMSTSPIPQSSLPSPLPHHLLPLPCPAPTSTPTPTPTTTSPPPASLVCPARLRNSFPKSASLQDLMALMLANPTLDSVETRVLHHLTPQGIAKLNHDLLADIPFCQVLAELTAAYNLARERRQKMENGLTIASHLLVDKLPRRPTYDELVMFSSLSAEYVQDAVDDQMKKGMTFEAAIEELALQFQHFQVMRGVSAEKEAAQKQCQDQQQQKVVPTAQPAASVASSAASVPSLTIPMFHLFFYLSIFLVVFSPFFYQSILLMIYSGMRLYYLTPESLTAATAATTTTSSVPVSPYKIASTTHLATRKAKYRSLMNHIEAWFTLETEDEFEGSATAPSAPISVLKCSHQEHQQQALERKQSLSQLISSASSTSSSPSTPSKPSALRRKLGAALSFLQALVAVAEI